MGERGLMWGIVILASYKFHFIRVHDNLVQDPHIKNVLLVENIIITAAVVQCEDRFSEGRLTYYNLILEKKPMKFLCIFQSIGEELVMLEKGSIEACQAFIKKHSQNLHPNHYYLQVTFFNNNQRLRPQRPLVAL